MEYKFNSEKLREKRKALRIEKNGKMKMVSQDDFRDLLKERGCSIGRSSLSKLENGVIPDEVALKDIMAFCDILGCDLEYLLDISDYSNKELETVCEYTGLSEEAAKKLHELNNHDFFHIFPKLLSNLLCNYYQPFYHLIMNVFIYLRTRVEEKALRPVDYSADWDEVERMAVQEKEIKDSASISLMNCLHEIESMQDMACKDEMIKEQIELKHSVKK